MGNYYLTQQYSDAFSNLFKLIKEIYNQTNQTGQQFEGYLVDLNSFNKLLEIVNGLNGHPPQTKSFDLNNNETEKKQLHKLKTTNANNIINLIEQNQSFIIVNKEFYDVVCEKKDENKIIYKITPEKIILYLTNGTTKEFKNNKNHIINKSSLLEENKNNENLVPKPKEGQNYKDKIDRVYNDVNNYEKCQQDIIQKINNNSPKMDHLFLVDNVWIEKWKRNSFYDKIKAQYPLIQSTDEQAIKNLISNELSTNTSNYDELNDIENYIIKDVNQLSNIINDQSKSYIILDKQFLNEFCKDKNINVNTSQLNPISLTLGQQNIQVELTNGQKMNFRGTDNLIALNKYRNDEIAIPSGTTQQTPNANQTNEVYNSNILMNLIKFAFFKMKLNKLIKSGQNQAVSADLINKEVINKLKQIYKEKEIIGLLSDSKQLDGITYENANQKFSKISKFLNDNKPEYINSFKDLEIKGGISFSNTERNISLKRFNNNQKLIYIEDFEIIDNEFATFLSSKFAFKVNLMILPIIILPRENKIFTIITYKQNYIYEIVIPNNENIYKAEYILEILNNNPVTHDKKNLNNHILNVFKTYGIQKLIAQKSPFHTSNNIYFNLYPVNGSIH